jgi:uncharacterized iron-regulated membrane protein
MNTPSSQRHVRKTSQRRLWFLLHGWFSLPVWLLFCFVCVTGTIAVVSHEITWLVNPAARAANPDKLPRKPLHELVATAQQAVPGSEPGFVMVLEPYLVTAISVPSKEKPFAVAYVNPYTAKVQAVEEGITFVAFMRSLHGWLLFPWQHNWSVGYYFVAAMSIVVLGALVTGLVVYKRFWRAFTQPRLRFGRDARTVLGDLHRLAGVWSLWFLLIMGLTGFWYLTQAILWHNDIDVDDEVAAIAASTVPLSKSGSTPTHMPLVQALQAAQLALPQMQPSWIAMPEHNLDYYTIAGSDGSILFDDYSLRAFVNPWSGEVVTHTPADMNVLQVIAHIADPLHYGTFGGLVTKLIWFVFGLVLSSMSITGFLIWGKRTVKAARGARAASGKSIAGIKVDALSSAEGVVS